MPTFRFAVLSTAGALWLAIMAQPAAAMTMRAVYQGTVSSGQDVNGGVFGTAAQDLTGEAFTLTFLYNPNTPGATRTTDSTSDLVEGYGVFDPVLSAVLTINSQSYNFDTNYFGQAFLISNGAGGQGQSTHDAYIDHDDGSTYENSYVYANLFTGTLGQFFTASLESPITVSLGVGVSSDGHFQVGNCTYVITPCDQGSNGRASYGNLSPETLTISQVSAVPLPAALPLLATGLGALGFVGWRRKRTVAV